MRAALLSLLIASSAFGQSVDWSAGVVYEYDGSGNVRKIGTDTYLYDTAQRLIRGSVAGSQQSYTYDSFGNRKTCQTAGSGDCQYGFEIDSATNRVQGRTYDKRGNMLQLPEGNALEYDELGMVRKESGTLRQVYYIYTADDERIAVYETTNTLPQTHTWQWTVRGLDKKPLREFTSEGASGTANFKWSKDHVWREGVLLASRQADASASGGVSTYHYHVDHLGTPRQVTSAASAIIGRHDYLPFGPELTSTTRNEPKLQDLKFTGHERDFASDRPPLDYMHARYYEPRLGRFLAVDPGPADLRQPQSWNRYSYVLNNPVNLTDPTGRCVWDLCIGEAAAVHAAGAVLTAATIYVLAPSPAVPGKSNGQVMVDTAIDGFQAAGSWLLNGSGGGADEMAAQHTIQNWQHKEASEGTAGGDRAGKPFTPRGKKEIYDRNAEQNGGENRCERCDDKVVPGQKSQKGVTPPSNERQADHIIPKSAGGDGSPSNGQTLCRKCNRDKSDKLRKER